MTRFTCVVAALLGCLALGVPVAAQTGSITGEVVAAGTMRPLSGAQVVAGTIGMLTDQAGRYVLLNVPAGPQTVRVELIGYGFAERTVTVVAGEPAIVNFELAETAIALDEVVVDVLTGETRRKRELANTVGSIRASEMEAAPVTKVTDVLMARVPGVVVQASTGTSGTSAPIRIRGATSLSLRNEPLIIVDGVRFDNSSSFGLAMEGGKPSRLDDLNPENFESIEVLRGPAASGMFGTAAANGVIIITTKQGRPGKARFNVYTETGVIQDPGTVPSNYAAARTDASGRLVPSGCLLVEVADGECTQETVVSFNPWLDERTSPVQTGHRTDVGMSISGGVQGFTYFLAGGLEREQGIYEVNKLSKANFRANLSGQLREQLRMSVNMGYVTSRWSIPPDNWGVYGMFRNSLGGSAFFNPDSVSKVYYRFTPEQVSSLVGSQDIDRVTTSLKTDWQPLEWLNATATVGLDLIAGHDHRTLQPGALPISVATAMGQRTSQRSNRYQYTANMATTARYGLMSGLDASTTVGLDYNRDLFELTSAGGSGLLQGTESVSATSAFFTVGEATQEVISVGYFLQQQLAFRDRLFATLGLRGDDNSAFGSDFGFAIYPSLGLSWLVSEEAFFPESDLLSSLRVRGSFGRSGLRPGFRQAVTYYSPGSVRFEGEDVIAVTLGGTGNPDLKPETVNEVEFGMDAGMFDDRLSLMLTYYDKRSSDALIARTLAPSLGVNLTRFENLGEVRNSGFEIGIDARLVRTRNLEWSSRLSMSTLDNEIVTLGEGIEPIVFQRFTNYLQRHAEGYPAGGYWDRPLSYEDRNGDGMLSTDEVSVGDEDAFLGRALPSYSTTLSNTVRVGEMLEVSALLEARGGHMQLNLTEHRRCLDALSRPDIGCQGMYDPNATLAQQAAFIGFARYQTQAGYIEKADFVKLREISVSLTPPAAWVPAGLGVNDVRLTFAARNLKTWTDYSGIDPEVNQGTVDDSPFPMGEYFTPPVNRFYTARLSFSF